MRHHKPEQGNWARLHARQLTLWFACAGPILVVLFVVFIRKPSLPRQTSWQLYQRADSLYNSLQYDSALTIAKRSFEIAKTETGIPDSAIAKVLNLMGEICRRQAHYSEGKRYLQLALDLQEKDSQSIHSGVGEALHSLASLYIAERHFKEAEPLVERAILLVRQRNDSDPRLHVKLLAALGKIYWGVGRYAESEFTFRRALSILNASERTDSLDLAMILYGLGTTVGNTDHFSDAEPLLCSALTIRERVLGDTHPDVAACQMTLGKYYMDQQRFGIAESLLTRSLEIFTKLFSADHPAAGNILGSLGDVYFSQNRLDDAEKAFSRVLKAAEENSRSNSADYSVVLGRLAAVYEAQGRYAEAEPLYERGLNLFERTWGVSHPYCSVYVRNLACLYIAEGKDPLAEQLLERALDIEFMAYGATHPEYAYTQTALAQVYSHQGRCTDAEILYRSAQTILENAYQQNHPRVADALNGAAGLASYQGHYAKAERSESLAWRIRHQAFCDGITTLTERNALEYSHFLNRETSDYLSILVNKPKDVLDNSDVIARIVFSSKGVVTDGIMTRYRKLEAHGDSTGAEIANSLRNARFALSTLYATGLVKDNVEVFQKKLDAAVKNKERLEVELARQSTSFRREQELRDVDASMLTRYLPAGCALVEFMKYQHRMSLTETEARYLAVLLKANGNPLIIQLGNATDIDAAVARYRRHFDDRGKISVAAYIGISEDVYHLVWRRLAAYLEGANTVYVAPDGSLNLISFAGLLDDNGKYLIEKYPIHYLSSGRDLIRLQDTISSCSGLLAIGDPDFDLSLSSMLPSGASSASVMSSRSFRSKGKELEQFKCRRLPATRKEVEAVAKQWRFHKAESIVTRFGADATEDHFKREAPGKRVLYLATHGFYFSHECLAGKVAESETFFVENPYLQCGLLLAGANQHRKGIGKVDCEDGILTAEDVAGMNLNGTDLVVLSACETGLGEVKSGEGVYGLRRAFQMAGAKTVISSLWSIDDETTAELMGQLFSVMDETIPQTMQRIALNHLGALRAQGKSDHPFYWAAFVATGDWKMH
jgi:CHAT domain-containing protein/Tfp pilus assembly protein PilF